MTKWARPDSVIFIAPKPDMVSFSHWGMFELIGHPTFMVPADFHVSDEMRADMMRPGAFIELARHTEVAIN